MRKISAIIPVFAAKDLVKGFLHQSVHFEKMVFLIHDKVWTDFIDEHGYDGQPDETEDIIREYMKTHPNVEVHHVKTETYDKWKRVPQYWNPGLQFVSDCDIAFKLDVDTFFTPEDWNRITKLVKETDYDAYVLDFSPATVTNYYVTNSFEYGRDDSDGQQVLAFNTKYPLEHEQNTTGRSCFLTAHLPGIRMYHLRGWKPKYTKEWAENFSKTWIKSIPQEMKNYFI